ncbi:MAG: DUF1501 domain-containing protein [Planctomycetota bacterium]|nr:DUF1501 domain-containing protein [Planctomycetales bacterium]RLT08004.1 MAG: DUF1501 domain-containing protein [Planctomycetota bacterium]
MSHFSRRNFLRSSAAGSAVLTFGGLAPSALQAAAEQSKSERILVVIELQGGNDGLNTVIPVGDETYRKLRSKLAIAKNDSLEISDGLAFHSSLRGFADLLEAGRLAVIQGVGYPDPNRSHFESMDIWHTCQRKDENRTDGWLGRLLEQTPDAGVGDPSALHLGHDKQPFAFMSRKVRVPSIRSLEQFHLQGTEDAQFRQAVQELTDARRGDSNDLLNFVQSSTSSAISASERLSSSVKSYSSSVTYPQNGLGEQLQTVAKLISSGLKTSVYYVTLNGFDTHSQQPDAHAGLLRQLGDSVKAFLEDIDQLKHSDRVALMCFSEFGRRVEENASAGTDHGTAGPMFMAGAMVKPGLFGELPSLSNLQDGDLRHHTDFRQVYAAVIQNWFQCEAEPILKGQYNAVDLFATMDKQ